MTKRRLRFTSSCIASWSPARTRRAMAISCCGGEQRRLADFVEVLVEDVAVGIVDAERSWRSRACGRGAACRGVAARISAVVRSSLTASGDVGGRRLARAAVPGRLAAWPLRSLMIDPAETRSDAGWPRFLLDTPRARG